MLGLDNLDATYSVALKRARLARCEHERFTFLQGDVASPADLARAFASGVDRVVHLAAQVGVRPSLVDPEAYLAANLVGFCRTIEAARQAGVKHFLFASSSSVHGANRELPFTEAQRTDHPVSFYAATKKADELVAHAYGHSHRLPVTALRLFTVYGPWGRPDMAIFAFARAIAQGTPLRLHGKATRRDFTYIDDAAAAIIAALDRPPVPTLEAGSGGAPDPVPFRVLNVGSGRPVALTELVALLERGLGRRAMVEVGNSQAGDMPATWASLDELDAVTGYRPETSLAAGVARFVDWYLGHYVGRFDDVGES